MFATQAKRTLMMPHQGKPDDIETINTGKHLMCLYVTQNCVILMRKQYKKSININSSAYTRLGHAAFQQAFCEITRAILSAPEWLGPRWY